MDSTNVLAALRGVVSYVQEQWSNSVPVNIVLVTDEGENRGGGGANVMIRLTLPQKYAIFTSNAVKHKLYIKLPILF
jgi:hypothetical protein